ncbi:NAD(P)-binding protein, partial [Aureobasidium melanogenum]
MFLKADIPTVAFPFPSTSRLSSHDDPRPALPKKAGSQYLDPFLLSSRRERDIGSIRRELVCRLAALCRPVGLSDDQLLAVRSCELLERVLQATKICLLVVEGVVANTHHVKVGRLEGSLAKNVLVPPELGTRIPAVVEMDHDLRLPGELGLVPPKGHSRPARISSRLVRRICPGIRVMEVKVDAHALVSNTLGQLDIVIEVVVALTILNQLRNDHADVGSLIDEDSNELSIAISSDYWWKSALARGYTFRAVLTYREFLAQRQWHLLDLDADLAEVLLVPLELVSFLELVESEDLLVDDRLDVVGLNGSVHLLKLLSAADIDTANGTDVDESIEKSGLLVVGAADEADDGDNTLEANGLERLLQSVGTTDLDDVVDTDTAGDLLCGLTPVGVLAVVDNVVSTEGLELLALLLGRSGGDDTSTSSLSELDGEDRDTTGTLGKDPVTGGQSLALETVETVPGSKTSAGERSTLDEVEVARKRDKTLLVVNTVLLEGAVNNTTSSSGDGLVVKRTGKVALVELGNDLVTNLEALDLLADSLNNTSTVRSGDNVVLLREGHRGLLFRLVLCEECLIVTRLTFDKNILVTNLRNRSFLVELQVVERSSTLDSPLLLGRRCHCGICVGLRRLEVHDPYAGWKHQSFWNRDWFVIAAPTRSSFICRMLFNKLLDDQLGAESGGYGRDPEADVEKLTASLPEKLSLEWTAHQLLEKCRIKQGYDEA